MTPSEVWPAADSEQPQQPTIPTATAKAMRQALVDAQIRADAAEAAILLSHGLTPQQAMAIMQAGAPPPLVDADLEQDEPLPESAQEMLDSLRRGQQRAKDDPEGWAEAGRVNARILQLAEDRAAGRDKPVPDLGQPAASNPEADLPQGDAPPPPKRRRRPPPTSISYI